MKKFVAVLAICLMMVGMISLPVAAEAIHKEEMIEAAREHMPAELFNEYLPLIENVLSQVSVNEDQADQVIACIEEARDFFKNYKGISLSEYLPAEREFALEIVDRICEILGLNAVYTHSEDPEHYNDVVLELYNDAGQKIADVDPDAVKKTNIPETTATPVNYTYVVLAVVLLLGSVAAVMVSKKFAAER